MGLIVGYVCRDLVQEIFVCTLLHFLPYILFSHPATPFFVHNSFTIHIFKIRVLVYLI